MEEARVEERNTKWNVVFSAHTARHCVIAGQPTVSEQSLTTGSIWDRRHCESLLSEVVVGQPVCGMGGTSHMVELCSASDPLFLSIRTAVMRDQSLRSWHTGPEWFHSEFLCPVCVYVSSNGSQLQCDSCNLWSSERRLFHAVVSPPSSLDTTGNPIMLNTAWGACKAVCSQSVFSAKTSQRTRTHRKHFLQIMLTSGTVLITLARMDSFKPPAGTW